MSQPTNITDDPLPPADPVTPMATVQAVALVDQEEDHPVELEDPDLAPASSYGRTDPASLAAVQSLDLSDPSMQALEGSALNAPDLGAAAAVALTDLSITLFKPGEGVEGKEKSPEKTSVDGLKVPDFSNWDPHLAHLAQVGLTSADHWEEQIKPRIDQLHEDITQVNVQLDDLEKAKPKPKPK